MACPIEWLIYAERCFSYDTQKDNNSTLHVGWLLNFLFFFFQLRIGTNKQ